MGRAKIKAGRTLKGHKIGLTSRAMQVSSNITEPDYGALLDDMFFDEGSDIPFERFIVPRVEVELAFILGKPLKGPNCTVFDVLDATEWVIRRWKSSTPASSRSTPHQRHPQGVRHHLRQRRQCRCGARRPRRAPHRDRPAQGAGGAVSQWRDRESGVSAAVLNHPAKGVAWLANKLAPYDVTLLPGQVILGSSFTRPVAARPGDTFHVDYDLLGSIACRFV